MGRSEQDHVDNNSYSNLPSNVTNPNPLLKKESVKTPTFLGSQSLLVNYEISTEWNSNNRKDFIDILGIGPKKRLFDEKKTLQPLLSLIQDRVALPL